MPMQLIETKILQNAVYMRLADDPEPQKAAHWIEFRAPLDELLFATFSADVPLGDIEKRYLGSVRQSALRYARDKLSEEIQAIANRIGR
jgi:hypothetical protein